MSLKLFLSFILIFAIITIFAQTSQMRTATSGGIGIGTIIAVVLSWSRNKSILWCLLHAFFGWFYVIYYLFTRSSKKTTVN